MMDMTDLVSFTTMDVIVLLALGFTVVFLIAWACSPGLRAWIERPKYRFMAEIDRYDRGLR